MKVAIISLVNDKNDNVFFDIKDFLELSTKTKWDVSTDFNLRSQLNFNKKELLLVEASLKEIDPTGNLLDYKIVELNFEPSNIYVHTDTEAYEILIGAIDKNIIKAYKQEINAHVQCAINQIDNPNVKPILPILVPPKLQKSDLANLDTFKTCLQTCPNLQSLTVGQLNLSSYLLQHYRKHLPAVELYMYELICRGDKDELTNLLQAKVSVNQTRTVTKRKYSFLKDVSEDNQTSMSDSSVNLQSNAFSIKANFTMSTFGDYVKGKKEASNSACFLGFEDDVKQCLEKVISDERRVSQIMDKFSEVGACAILENCFNF